ncbi:MAG: chromosomal replication initiator protein DnaA [Planctomycetota bacterium]
MKGPVAENLCTIRERLVARIGAPSHRTWFGGSTRLQLVDDSLDVVVPNEFIGRWITRNYLDDLQEAAREVLGEPPRVAVRVEPCECGAEQAAAGSEAAPVARRDGEPAAHHPRRRPAERPTLRGELESFVVGPSNELAYSVALAVVRAPGKAFKHLVLHSGCGLGKTHLLHGICNGLSRAHPALQWCFLSGEEFTNEFIYAVKSGRVDGFRARFRNVDVLVIDDIHFLANKRATQDEFLHTFDALDTVGQTVVLSCDCHPRSIATLSEPLISRLSAAMIVRIDAPEFATRREILRRRAAKMPLELPDEVLDYVARQIVRNVRELEGALYKLAAYAALTHEPIGLELARRAVEDYVANNQPVKPEEIERISAAHFGVTVEALRSRSRDRSVTLARSVTMYLLRKHTQLSFPEIGRQLGQKQHSTVIMAVRRIRELLDQEGAVTWKTPAGPREAPARAVLDELELRLFRGPPAG